VDHDRSSRPVDDGERSARTEATHDHESELAGHGGDITGTNDHALNGPAEPAGGECEEHMEYEYWGEQVDDLTGSLQDRIVRPP
jgi:hypothetical protein